MAQDPDQVRLQGRGERPWVPWRRRRGATTLPSPAASSECLEIPYRKEAGRKEMPVTLSDLLFFFFSVLRKTDVLKCWLLAPQPDVCRSFLSANPEVRCPGMGWTHRPVFGGVERAQPVLLSMLSQFAVCPSGIKSVQGSGPLFIK